MNKRIITMALAGVLALNGVGTQVALAVESIIEEESSDMLEKIDLDKINLEDSESDEDSKPRGENFEGRGFKGIKKRAEKRSLKKDKEKCDGTCPHIEKDSAQEEE